MTTAILLLTLAAAQGSPFNGKDLHGWAVGKKEGAKSQWKVGVAEMDPGDGSKVKIKGSEGELVNAGKGVDLQTEMRHADVLLEVEFMVPKGGASAIFMMGAYEFRIADSYGKEKPGPKDMGALGGGQVPLLNASKPAGEWQKLVIDFRGPRFDRDGRRTHTARFVKVVLNGKTIHRNVEMKKPSKGALRKKDVKKGPLLLKGDRGAVAFRNFKLIGATR